MSRAKVSICLTLHGLFWAVGTAVNRTHEKWSTWNPVGLRQSVREILQHVNVWFFCVWKLFILTHWCRHVIYELYCHVLFNHMPILWEYLFFIRQRERDSNKWRAGPSVSVTSSVLVAINGWSIMVDTTLASMFTSTWFRLVQYDDYLFVVPWWDMMANPFSLVPFKKKRWRGNAVMDLTGIILQVMRN